MDRPQMLRAGLIKPSETVTMNAPFRLAPPTRDLTPTKDLIGPQQ